MGLKVTFILKYCLFWLLFFVIARMFFLGYNLHFTKDITFLTILGTFIHGIRLDLSMMGYLAFFMTLILSIAAFNLGKVASVIIKVYSVFILVLFSSICVGDAELYRNWGYKMDNTVLFYLRTPKEAFASTQVWLSILLFAIFIVITFLAIKFYLKYVHNHDAIKQKTHGLTLFIYLFIAATFIIPIRGGFGIAPINTGTVYFSNKSFANHAAINTFWNFLESISQVDNEKTAHFMEDSIALKTFTDINTASDIAHIQIINKAQPNILIIIFESFTANIIEPLGGVKDVTPNFTKLCKQGVLFSNMMANGDRSDKGIASILSGYPAQPTSSIIKYDGKSSKLPHLSKKLMADGYSSAFYYGGDINFANMQAYFLNGNYQKIITKDNFSKEQANSKWGAHDQWVFSKLFTDINEDNNKPFFKAYFTLSSHEPFIVPFKGQFNKSDEESKFLNAANYTDSCFGDFIEKAQKQEWWDNTWIICIADHGNRQPGNIAYNCKSKFRIPMLWLGGALSVSDTIISSQMNQADIPLMIGNQLHKNYNDFIFSKDALNGAKPYSFFAFNNGFGYFNDKGDGFTWDLEANKLIKKYNNASELDFINGKAYVQTLLNDFNSK